MLSFCYCIWFDLDLYVQYFEKDITKMYYDYYFLKSTNNSVRIYRIVKLLWALTFHNISTETKTLLWWSLLSDMFSYFCVLHHFPNHFFLPFFFIGLHQFIVLLPSQAWSWTLESCLLRWASAIGQSSGRSSQSVSPQRPRRTGRGFLMGLMPASHLCCLLTRWARTLTTKKDALSWRTPAEKSSPDRLRFCLGLLPSLASLPILLLVNTRSRSCRNTTLLHRR